LDRLGAFSWGGVSGAYQYEFQIAGSANFQTPANSGGQDDYTTQNTRVSLFKTMQDGTYYWRVRSQTQNAAASSAWSATCSFTLHWTDKAVLNSPVDTTVSYPTPLVLNWSAVKGAAQYRVTVSPTPDLSNPLQIGGNNFPVTTRATSYSPSARLAEGTYYWGVTPIDSEGNAGTPSEAHSFTWAWPSSTGNLTETDLDPSQEVTDPQFSWDAIHGAASYEIEINSNFNWGSSTKVCCTDKIISTTFAPPTLLPAGNYHWRIRAVDPNGNYGGWVEAPSTFPVSYDTNSITNLRLVDSNDAPETNYPVATDTPILSWDPTPGAASYLVDVAPFTNNVCQYTLGAPQAWHTETAATSWTPLGDGLNAQNPWPNTGHNSISGDNSSLQVGVSYCVRVRAERGNDTKGNQVYGTYFDLGGPQAPAFTFSGYPTGKACTQPCNSNFNIGDKDYILPAATGNTRLPLFTWKPIAGVQSYFVIIATDPQFQNVYDEAFTHIPAYAPRSGSQTVNYLDTDPNTQYYWAVLPSPNFNGQGAGSDPTSPASYPHTFDMHSVVPQGVSPAGNAAISTQPTFQWTPVGGAIKYQLEVSTDPGFGTFVGGTPLYTDSVSYTGTNFPASAHLYWRVQAVDKNGHGLTWSTAQQFQKTLAAPTFTGTDPTNLYTNPSATDAIPLLHWDEMPGAIAYNLSITVGTSTTNVNNLQTTAFAPTSLPGTGAATWKVQAVYPTTGQSLPSGWGTTQSFARTILPPGSMVSSVSGQHQVLMSWGAKAGAASYAIRVATNSQFTNSSVFETSFTNPENTVYAPDLKNGTYANGGNLYWEVAAKDADNNQGAWSAPKLLALPTTIHGSSSTNNVAHRVTTTVKVSAMTGSNAPISGVLVKVSGAGLTSTSHTTASGGYATFKLKPTKTGTITFTLTKSGCVSTTVKINSY
jgi:hypothetical protein